ncbi:MAG: hypothetical protein AAB421_05750 [Patescibacteria group bacterium]
MLSLSERKKLLDRCTHHPTNTFYRNLYGLRPGESLTCATEDDWQKIRPLTKADLAATPLQLRSFLPLSVLDHLRASSGTSGQPPLFSPRTHVRHLDYRLAYHDFKKPFLTFSVPMMPHWHEMVQTELGLAPRVITIDPQYPEATVRLADIAGVDAASLFAYQLRTIGEAMKQSGLNKKIKFLEIAGEACSRARYEYARETFPNATLVHSYGSSEVEDVPMGIPCGTMRESEPYAVYHPKKSHFLEIADSDGRVIAPHPGAEGDLLITAYPGEPSAFPLIRFKIGDTAHIVELPCTHEEPWSFTILGRTEIDFLKIEGGVVRVDELERVLRSVDTLVTDEFELHRHERQTPDGPRVQLELHVQLKKPVDLDTVAHLVAENLRISPEKTYAQGVASGRFLPLICLPLIKRSPNQKHKRVISHT